MGVFKAIGKVGTAVGDILSGSPTRGGLFDNAAKKSAGVPDRARNAARRSTASPQSTDNWMASMASSYKASPAGQAANAAVDKKLAQNAWESNNSKMRAAGDAAWKAKYDKPEPQKKETGGFVTSEGGRAISTERM